MKEFLAKYWINLVVAVAAAGFTYGVMRTEVTGMDNRVKSLEDKSEAYKQVGWQVAQDKERIKELEQDQKKTAESVAEIKSNISVINTKLDQLLEAVKRKP